MILSTPDPLGGRRKTACSVKRALLECSLSAPADPDTPLVPVALHLLGSLWSIQPPPHGRNGKAPVWARIAAVALPVMTPQQAEGAA